VIPARGSSHTRFIKGREPGDIGRYAGWGSEEDAHDATGPGESTGPAMMPFLRHRPGDRWWKVGIGFAYLPAVVVIVSLELMLHLDQALIWLSLGVFYVVFLAAVYVIQRR